MSVAVDRLPTPGDPPGAPVACAAVRLAWVLVDGEDNERLLPVSRFALLAPAARPAARCPACRAPVTLKLGEVRMHHAAHQPGSRCTVESGEGALHLNAKCALWARLAREAAPDAVLAITAACGAPTWEDGSSRRATCAARLETALAAGWDAAEVELALDGARPDVVLLRAGAPVAAIELVASHAVDERKARRLARLGVPWVEVEAWRAAALVERDAALTLPATQLGAGTRAGGPWRCAHHARRAATRGARRANGHRPWKARVVDRYGADGRWVRDVFVMEAELRGGRVVAVRLVHARDDDVLTRVARPTREEAARALHAAFVRWARARRAEGLLVDSPMPWVDARRLWIPPALREGTGPMAAWKPTELVMPKRWRWEGGRWRRSGTDAAARWYRA